MTYTFERIIADVRALLGENRRCVALLGVGDSDTLSLDEMICGSISAAATAVASAAPREMLGEPTEWADETTAVEPDGDFCGIVALPDNFMRLASFRLEGWKRAVISPLPEGSVLAQIAVSSPFPVMIADNTRPFAEIISRPDGYALRFFSAVPACEACVAQALYWPLPLVGSHDSIDFPFRLYPALVEALAQQVKL